MNDNEIGYIIKVVQGINMTISVFIYHVNYIKSECTCIDIYSLINTNTKEY